MNKLPPALQSVVSTLHTAAIIAIGAFLWLLPLAVVLYWIFTSGYYHGQVVFLGRF